MKSPVSRAARERVVLKLAQLWREWRGYVLFFCLIWVPVRSAVIDYNPVPTGSMNPTILEGDVVWVNKLAYGLRVPLTRIHVAQWAHPGRGDIVVVLSPLDGTRLVKRVVGVPGDILEMHENRLVLNGRPLDYAHAAFDYRPTIARGLRAHAVFAEEDLAGVVHPVMGLSGVPSTVRSFPPVAVPPGRYFLMGDSRDNSFDSRQYGFADRDAILGKAEGVIVSVDIKDRYLPRMRRFFSALQ
jgi:signal peptidase I